MGQQGSAPAAPLTEADVEHLAAHSHYRAQEIEQLHKQFISEVPSGFIPRGSFDKLAELMGIREGHVRELVFNAFDTDPKDGFISFYEFVVSMSAMTRGTPDEKLGLAFRLYDTGGPDGRPRGFLTKEDLLRVTTSLSGMLGDLLTVNGTMYSSPADLVDAIFHEMDVNRDGKITLQEYVAGAKRDPAIVQGLALF
eukprot:TRINITY_DN10421_c1_g3_i1.p1 TRINITY_DN10421_c1_g3~~TRINITY_DN10421_c1_g3_i1.p1  ORF type:complete len:196 (+),score=76.58 TRINITY_DN10421_c1_g3_i1:47-634(+)